MFPRRSQAEDWRWAVWRLTTANGAPFHPQSAERVVSQASNTFGDVSQSDYGQYLARSVAQV